MVWHEIVNMTANVATAVSVFLAALSLWRAKLQRQTALEDSLAKEYREIIYRLPINALLNIEENSNNSFNLIKEIYCYIDFTNEQAFLRKKGRIRKSTWLDWVDGIKSNLEKPTFRDAWKYIKDKTGQEEFTELRDLEKSGYKMDPKIWFIHAYISKWR